MQTITIRGLPRSATSYGNATRASHSAWPGAELLAPIDQPLHPVAFAVDGAIKGSSAILIAFPWDGKPYLVPGEILVDLPAAVPFVPDNAVRSPLGSTRPDPLHSSIVICRRSLLMHGRNFPIPVYRQ